MRSLLFGTLLSISVLGCKKQSSIIDFFRFPTQQDIEVLLKIQFQLNEAPSPAIDASSETYQLRAASIEEDQEPLLLAREGEDFTPSLPLSFSQASTDLGSFLSLPFSLSAGKSDFAVVYSLSEVNPTPSEGASIAGEISGELEGGDVPPPVLLGLLPEIENRGKAAAKSVPMSVATTVATRVLLNSLLHPGKAPGIIAYREMIKVFEEKLMTIETTLAEGVKSSPALLSRTLAASLELQILNDLSLQKYIADCLIRALEASNALSEESDEETRQAGEIKLVTGFTRILLRFAGESQLLFGDPAGPAQRVLKPKTIDPNSLMEPGDFLGSVFAPSAVSFVDTDPAPTLGGTVLITAPSLTRGISSYKVYFGGEERSTSRRQLIGTVAAQLNPLSITLAAGTVQANDVTRIWVYAVTSDAKEIDIPASVSIRPLLTLAPPSAFRLTTASPGAGTVTLVWEPSARAETYVVRRGTSPGSCETILNSKASSPYVDTTPLIGALSYYCIEAVNAFGVTAGSGELSALSRWPLISLGATGATGVSSVDLETDSQGGLYLLARITGPLSGTSSVGSSDVLLTKYGTSGQLIWQKRFGSSNCPSGAEVLPYDMTIDTANDIYVVGASCGTLSTDPSVGLVGETAAFIVKFSTGGQPVFTRMFGVSSGSEGGASVARTTAMGITHDELDNIYLVGKTNGSLDGQSKFGDVDGFISRFQTDGDRVWTRLIGASGAGVTYPWTVIRRVEVDGDNHIIVAGQTSDADSTTANAGSLAGNTAIGARDSFVAKYQEDGSRLWLKQLGTSKIAGTGFLDIQAILTSHLNSIVVAGQVRGDYGGQGLSGTSDRFIQKLDSNGQSQWIVQSGSAGSSHSFTGLALSSNGTIIAAGKGDGSIDGEALIGTEDSVISAYNSNGTRLWTRRQGVASHTFRAVSLTAALDGAFALAGDTDLDLSVGTNSQNLFLPGLTWSYLAKFNQNGLR